MAAVALLIVGALLCITGATLIYWPAGICVGGVLAVAAGVDLGRTPPSSR